MKFEVVFEGLNGTQLEMGLLLYLIVFLPKHGGQAYWFSKAGDVCDTKTIAKEAQSFAKNSSLSSLEADVLHSQSPSC